MARKSIILLNSTGTSPNVVGPAVKAAGYYGSGMNIHTIAIYLNNFRGRIFVDGTLASNPDENDWFPINLNGYTDFVQIPDGFMQNPPPLPEGISGTFPLSFDGNMVYIRARVDRSYLPNFNTTDYGSVDKILLNY